MAGTHKVRFKNEVFVARTASGDAYTRIITGTNNLTLIVNTDAGPVERLVSVTNVEDEGKTIGWNSDASLAVRFESNDVIRVHLKHTRQDGC